MLAHRFVRVALDDLVGGGLVGEGEPFACGRERGLRPGELEAAAFVAELVQAGQVYLLEVVN